jgi:hypothetical protein
MYGVLASPHLPTNNFVGANQVTAQARAEAFAMSQALNAVQTITDGCTYRLDQIPACTYEECLKSKPDYPVNRAEEGDGIPFLDPATIPQDDAAFADWYREHVKVFFSVQGDSYDRLFRTHDLEHKKTGATKSVAFDALACDGVGNYAKCTQDKSGKWSVEDLAARSYGPESKAQLKSWIVDTYSKDLVQAPAPLTEDRELLSLKKATQKARGAIEGGVPEVYFPLGLEYRRLLNYKAIKASAFIFRTPEQRAAVVKQIQKFEEKHGAGLEVLALRRSYGDRREGSLADLAKALYRLILSDGNNVTKVFNLGKLPYDFKAKAGARVRQIEQQRQKAEKKLVDAIDTRKMAPEALVAAYVVSEQDLIDSRARQVADHALLAG